MERSVNDVAELVARLSEPPQPVDRADQAIHAAARSATSANSWHCCTARRTISTPEEAVHPAATSFTVEELLELISRLPADRSATPNSAANRAKPQGTLSESEDRPADYAHEDHAPAFADAPGTPTSLPPDPLPAGPSALPGDAMADTRALS